jgi:hypothetical protein
LLPAEREEAFCARRPLDSGTSAKTPAITFFERVDGATGASTTGHEVRRGSARRSIWLRWPLQSGIGSATKSGRYQQRASVEGEIGEKSPLC